MNKRTQILKQITLEKAHATEQILPILPIHPPSANKEQFCELLEPLLVEQMQLIAKQLKVKTTYLQVWLSRFQGASALSRFTLLHLIERYGLDPFLEEVSLVQYEDQNWQAVITPQGYARLINACPQFKGICYAYSDSQEQAVADWIECAIYRTDREGPITVREYYAEVKRDGAAWEKMPKRMLRNRAFQQCAKLALGI